jgi:O-antigen/teichoic acid export membrane protein
MADETQVSAEELRNATLKGVRWISATRLAFEFVAAAGAIVLAHLVPPADYGRFAIALVLPEIALSLVNEGLGTPLVQRKELERGHIEGTMAVGVLGGLILTILTYFLAPLIAGPLFGNDTAALFQLYSPVFTIAGVMIVPLAILQRRLEFDRIGISEVASAAATTLVSVALALAGLNAKAYVLGSLAGIAAWAVVLLLLARTWPGSAPATPTTRSSARSSPPPRSASTTAPSRSASNTSASSAGSSPGSPSRSTRGPRTWPS